MLQIYMAGLHCISLGSRANAQWTVLHYAAAGGARPVVEWLMAQGVERNAVDKHDRSAAREVLERVMRDNKNAWNRGLRVCLEKVGLRVTYVTHSMMQSINVDTHYYWKLART